MNAAFSSDCGMMPSRALIVRRARTLVGASDAEDIVQDAFERALRSRTFRPGMNPYPWMARIARNVAFDALRKRARNESIGTRQPDAESAERTALRRETAHEIKVALQVLSAAQRRAIVLHDLEGYSSREIAAIDGISVNTVRTRIFRGRQRLRSTLTQTYE